MFAIYTWYLETFYVTNFGLSSSYHSRSPIISIHKYLGVWRIIFKNVYILLKSARHPHYQRQPPHYQRQCLKAQLFKQLLSGANKILIWHLVSNYCKSVLFCKFHLIPPPFVFAVILEIKARASLCKAEAQLLSYTPAPFILKQGLKLPG